MLGKTRLLKDLVRGVTRFDVVIHGNVSIVYRAEPNFVIAFALPMEIAACVPQKFFKRFCETAQREAYSSDTKDAIFLVAKR